MNDVARACRERWGLVADGAFPHTYGHVEPVLMADGTPAVLKIPPTDELDALEWFSGRGGVRVLAIDRECGAALLERVLPGTRLVSEPEEVAVGAAADVMRALWRPPAGGHAFPTVRDWGRPLEPGSRAAGIFAALCDSMGEQVVLHGDLHHDNVLRSSENGWVAIDGKGVVGERAYEPGALLRNPRPGLLDEPHPARLLRRRSARLAEALDLDAERVRGWAYAQAVLAAVWHVQDGEDPAFALACAELLEPLTRGR
jgi:streptomycin 6-kinase